MFTTQSTWLKFSIALVGLLLWSSLISPLYAADTFGINNASAELSETQLNAQANFSLRLNNAVTEALHNGIPVTLTTLLSLSSKRRLLWNKNIANWQQKHQISYHSLTDRYQLKSTLNDETLSFASVREVLDKVEAYRLQTDVLRQTMPKSSRGYQLKLMVKLDIESLPPALRIVAYASPSWRLKSKTCTWSIP